MTTIHTYTPHGACREAFTARDPEILLAGPAGTGKSRVLLERLLVMALKYPGMRGLIVRKTLASLGSTALVTWREHVAKEALATGVCRYYGGSAEEAPQYQFTNGSKIMIGGMDRPSRVMSSEYDCVIGETEVSSPSKIRRAYRRPYSGQLITIRTAAGNELTGTPNHPILTDQGWRALYLIREGDHVVSGSHVQDEPSGAHPHVTDQPATIAEVTRALTLANPGRAERVEAVPVDFHGDVTHSYVDVVSTLGPLHHRRGPFAQPAVQLDGDRGHLQQPVLVSARPLQECVGTAGAIGPATSGPAELAHPLTVGFGTPPRLGGPLPTGGEVGLPDRVDPHPRLPRGEGLRWGPPSDAPAAHLFLQAGGADVQGERGIGETGPGVVKVTLDRVVDISAVQAGPDSHVYNLETSEHWYIANGIISHNCVYVQEAVELNAEDWEALTTRLRNGKIPYQQIIADTNPDTPTHWLKIRGNLGTTRIIESRHEDNPLLYNPDGTQTDVGQAYISKLANLTGVRRQRLKDGLWVAAEGMIFEGFDPAVHVVDRFQVPDDWTRYWSVDFGYTNPFVWQSWAVDPDGTAILTDEIYMTRRTVDEHAAKILSVVTRGAGPVKTRQWVQRKPRAIICDHDAEGRAVLERELGMSTQAAYKVVTEGIQAVQVAMRDKGNGRRGVYFMRDALVERDGELVDAKLPTCTIEEIPGYVWDTGAGKAVKEVPLKKDDHGCDASRYLCVELTQGRPRVRVMSGR